jgi:hypothetical protein
MAEIGGGPMKSKSHILCTAVFLQASGRKMVGQIAHKEQTRTLITSLMLPARISPWPYYCFQYFTALLCSAISLDLIQNHSHGTLFQISPDLQIFA